MVITSTVSTLRLFSLAVGFVVTKGLTVVTTFDMKMVENSATERANVKSIALTLYNFPDSVSHTYSSLESLIVFDLWFDFHDFKNFSFHNK